MGPFKGCWMSPYVPPSDTTFVYHAVNMVFDDPVAGGKLVGVIADAPAETPPA